MSPARLSVPFNVSCASRGYPKPTGSIRTSQSPLRPLKCSRRALPGPSALPACPGQGLGASVLGPGPQAGPVPAASGPARPGLLPVPSSRERTRCGVTRRGGRFARARSHAATVSFRALPLPLLESSARRPARQIVPAAPRPLLPHPLLLLLPPFLSRPLPSFPSPPRRCLRPGNRSGARGQRRRRRGGVIRCGRRGGSA